MSATTSAPIRPDEARGDLFVNRRFEWERFVMVPHAWIRDTRITGNPMSLLLAIRMHADGFLMTTEGLKKQLGLGKDAFVRARKALVDAGYLRHDVRRCEGDSDAGEGMRKGQVLGSRYEVMDPWGLSPDSLPQGPTPPTADPVRLAEEKPWSSTEGGKAEADDLESEHQEAAFPPLNKNKINKTRFNKTKNHHPEGLVAAVGGDGGALAELDPRLDDDKIRMLLHGHDVRPELHHIDRAAREVLARARGVVNDPNAYVARAIAADQDSWHRWNSDTGAPLTSCDLYGHQPVSDDVETYCGFCAVLVESVGTP